MKLIFILFSIILTFFNIFYISFVSEYVLIYLFFFISIFFLYKVKMPFYKHLIFFQILFYLLFCHLLTPVLVFFNFVNYDLILLSNQLRLGYIYIFVSIFSFILFSYIVKRSSFSLNKFTLSSKYLYFLLIIMYIFTIISYILGLGKMGHETIYLPFKLTGIINYSRTVFFPYIFVIFLDSVKRGDRDNKFNKFAIILFFIWILSEAFIRQSRSALIEYSIPLVLYFLATNVWSFYKLLKYGAVLIIINILLYPIITNLRVDESKIVTSMTDADQERMWKRSFSNAFFYEKYYPYIHDELFKFSLVPYIIAEGGTHNFTTNVVDNLSSIKDTHNSGTTGLMDGYLFGGVGFSFLILILANYYAVYFDKSFLLKNPLELAYGFTLVKWLVWHRSVSLFLTPMDLLVLIILYFLVKNK